MERDRDIASLETPTLVIPPPSGGALKVRNSKLVVLNGPFEGREFIVSKDIFTIGSGAHNDLVLQDSTVSRRHCQIQRQPEGYSIRDLGSTNGTILQGVKITEAFLEPGTEFQLGTTKVIFWPIAETVEYGLSPSDAFGPMLGHSVAMRHVFYLADLYAPTEATILIEGETGTGKEILAREIHNHSPRREKPFVVIDCAALAKDLIQSELFGHVKGAFTGATADRVGAFEHANGGTVLLDEIGDLSLDLQPKLLRVIETREIRRVGSSAPRQVDVRILCATNRRLEDEVNAGRFREDLYYRLSVVHMHLPPLRKRKEDVPFLAAKFLKDHLGESALTQVLDFDKASEALRNHSWPGNVRELRNLVEIASYSKKRPIDLAAYLATARLKTQKELPQPEFVADQPFKVSKDGVIRKFEVEYIKDLLRKHAGNVSRAAREAGIERSYLQRLIRKYGMGKDNVSELESQE